MAKNRLQAGDKVFICVSPDIPSDGPAGILAMMTIKSIDKNKKTLRFTETVPEWVLPGNYIVPVGDVTRNGK